MKSAVLGALAFTASIIIATTAFGQPEPNANNPQRAAPAMVALGGTVFSQRCASCHEPPVEDAPNRADLATLSPAFIIDTLKTGSMRMMAQGLSEAELNSVAAYLTAH